MKSRDLEQLNDFIPYFNSFYGVNGIYSTGKDFTSAQILKALCQLFSQKPEHEFTGDTVDRELIRDILIDSKEQDRIYSKKGA